MTQTSLDLRPPPPPAPPKPQHPAQVQQRQLERVAGRIADDVLEFCRGRIGKPFHLVELVEFIQERRGGAPGSPDRILRQLRRDGALRYTVERAASLYTVTEVRA